jgi:diguanylate cyclase (GGDEF)-like protein
MEGGTAMPLGKRQIGFGVIVVVGVLAAMALHSNAQREYEAARARYLENSHASAEIAAKGVEDALRAIYENVRTLTLLPSVQKVDRWAKNLSDEGRATIQQVYNNLANNVSISEVYVLPADFDPNHIDTATGKPEEPIIMFDQLIVNARARIEAAEQSKPLDESKLDHPAEEVETYEYRAMVEQLAWLKQHYPTIESIDGLDVPMIASRELITCNNTDFIHTGVDADRSGIVFTIPFYGPDGKFKGGVAAIILSSALTKLLPAGGYRLLNPGYDYISGAVVPAGYEAGTSAKAFTKPDAALIYSEVIPLPINDPQSKWLLWAGFPDATFTESIEAQAVTQFEYAGFGAIALLVMGAMIWWHYVTRAIEATNEAAASLEIRVAERTAEIRHLAAHDMLTGLPNRATLTATMHEALKCVREGERLAVHCLDLDRFKPVNDTLGHPIGDKLLAAAAARLQQRAGETALVARIGGDEFIVLQLTWADADSAHLAEEIIEALTEPFLIEGHKILIGCSIGIASFPDDGADPDELIRNADIALYKSKAEGRSTWRRFEQGMDSRLKERRQLEGDLRDAVDKRQFVLHYQPLFDAGTSTLTGFEALVRWHHPERGLLLPGEFIQLAEEIGLIGRLGEWILGQACRDAAGWPADIKVAVNLSPAQFNQQGLPLQVVSALSASGLAATRLELEITESVLLANSEATMRMLHDLRALGVHIAMDDFGTGYSSLSYLRSFPFDRIKIDRSFVSHIAESSESKAIVRAVAELGATLGITTTAEGVETEEQFRLVREHGCTDVQGYYFGKPKPLAELAELLGRPARQIA